MSRRLLALLALGAASLAAQNSGNPQTPPDSPPGQLKTERPQPATSDKEEVPPEEDSSLVTTKYSFNPLQSKKDVLVGKEYAKKGNYRAAAGRYRDRHQVGRQQQRGVAASRRSRRKAQGHERRPRRLPEVPGSGCGRQERRRNPQESRKAEIAGAKFTHWTAALAARFTCLGALELRHRRHPPFPQPSIAVPTGLRGARN